MPLSAGVTPVRHPVGPGATAPSNLRGNGGGGMQANLHARHDGGELGDGALTITGTIGQGDVDGRTGPESRDRSPGHLPIPWPPPRDGGPPPLGLPALAGAAGCLAAASAGRSRPAASLGHAVNMASVPAGNKPSAGGAGGSGSGGAAHVPPLRNVLGGTFGAHGSSRGTLRRKRRPLGLCVSVQPPSRQTTRLPLGAAGRGPTPACAYSMSLHASRAVPDPPCTVTGPLARAPHPRQPLSLSCRGATGGMGAARGCC